MTQQQLAKAAGTTSAVISLLETGARPVSDRWLQKLAPILGVRSIDLRDVDLNWPDFPRNRLEAASPNHGLRLVESGQRDSADNLSATPTHIGLYDLSGDDPSKVE